MSRRRRFIPSAALLVMSALVFAHPSGIFAQAGAAGGHVGGGLAGGGGLSGTGRPTGIDSKDELRDFHAVLAAQATKEQSIRYFAVLKSTDAAVAELHSLLDTTAPQNTASDLAARAAALAKTIEAARVEDRNFLDTFSEPQKSALREATRKLLKADAELEQQCRVFSAHVESAKQLVANAGVGTALDAALTSFHQRQMELAEEMSIEVGDHGANTTYDLVPARTAIKIGGQGFTVTTSGVISQSKVSADESFFGAEVEDDLSDFQQNILEILNSKLGRSEGCGNRIEILDATLGASAPVSLLNLQLHFERWICMGGTMSEMAEGTGRIELKLSPSIASDGTLRVATEISRVDAEGLLGESLRSGSLGDEIRKNVSAILLSVVRDATDFKNILPPAVLGHASFSHAYFEATGLGRLTLVLNGEVQLSSEGVKDLISELGRKSSTSAPAQSAASR